MIALPAGTHIWVACGVTDMRKGFDSLAMVAQEVVKQSPRSGHVFVFRGRRADRLKILWWDGTGLCLYAKRMERGRFVWPVTQAGTVRLTPAQLSMLCEGIDWRSPIRTDMEAPRRAG
ncbi:MAG: IS66 family insertion sequence element accessory protein TnpB [Xanthobacteraceae bacterium]|jgi:transposase